MGGETDHLLGPHHLHMHLNPSTLSVFEVLIHLLKGNIGPGALSLPFGFAKAGIYLGPCIFIIVVRYAF